MYQAPSNEAKWCVSAFALSDVDLFVTDEAPICPPSGFWEIAFHLQS